MMWLIAIPESLTFPVNIFWQLAFPPEDVGPVAAELRFRVVAPPNKIKRGPIYPGVPSSPTAVTVVNVYPHLDPGFGWLVCSLIL